MSDLEVVNEALVRIGASPIASMRDTSASALVASTLYATARDTALADFPWSFALREEPLVRLAQQGGRLEAEKYTYQVPTDSVRILGLCCRSPYRLSGDQLYTDAPEATLAYISRVEPSAWSAGFRRVVVLELAAAMAVAVTDSSARADVFYREAAHAIARQRSLDSQQTPPHVFDLMRVYASRGQNFGGM